MWGGRFADHPTRGLFRRTADDRAAHAARSTAAAAELRTHDRDDLDALLAKEGVRGRVAFVAEDDPGCDGEEVVAVEAEELGYIDETSYRLISTRRASYPYYNYAYDVVFVNTSGFDIDNLVLQLTSTEPDPMILEGTVKFGFVPAGGSARSQNSFVLQHNRRLPLNLSLLNWEIE